MKATFLTIVGLAAAFLASARAAAAGEMAKETVAALKDATVFVKMDFKVPGFRELIPASGSGFLFKTDGKKGYVVSSFYILGGHDLWPELRAASPNPTVVFFSGTKKEKTLKAEQVEVDFERRLAIFRVDNLPDLPKPIAHDPGLEILETMPIFLFGFPFGDTLAGPKENPAVTVSKGSISSLRNNDRGELEYVQIDGDFNPGHAGAPVVDAKGRLVGIALGRLSGTRIGMALPAHGLPNLFETRLQSIRVTTLKVHEGKAEVRVQAWFKDPMEKAGGFAVHYVPAAEIKEKLQPGKDGWAKLPGARTVPLKFVDGHYHGTFTTESKSLGQLAYYFQPVIEHKDGKVIATAPRTFDVSFGRTLLVKEPVPDDKQPVLKKIAAKLEGKRQQIGKHWVTAYEGDIGSLELSADRQKIFSLTSVGKDKSVLRRLTLPDFVEEVRLELPLRIMNMTLSSQGLLLNHRDSDEVWLLDPESLAVRTRFKLGKVAYRLVSSPRGTMAVVIYRNPKNNTQLHNQLTTFDLVSGIVGKDYERTDFRMPKITVNLGQPAFSTDGQFLFTLGDNGQIHRFRVDGQFLTYAESTPPVAVAMDARISVSPDGSRLCSHFQLPNQPVKGYASGPDSTLFFSPTDLTKPIAHISGVKEIRSLAYHPAGGFFVSNQEKALMRFDQSGKKVADYDVGETDIFGQMVYLPGDRILLSAGRRMMVIELPKG